MTRIQNLLVKAKRRVGNIEPGTPGLVVGGVRDDDGEIVLVVDFCDGAMRECPSDDVEEART